MDKRSSFERRETDFYPTPAKAVAPLIPFLRAGAIRSFAEQCCGDGQLVRHLDPSACVASMPATSVPAEIPLRWTLRRVRFQSSRIHPTPAS